MRFLKRFFAGLLVVMLSIPALVVGGAFFEPVNSCPALGQDIEEAVNCAWWMRTREIPVARFDPFLVRAFEEIGWISEGNRYYSMQLPPLPFVALYLFTDENGQIIHQWSRTFD